MRKLAILLSALSVLLLAGKATPTWAQTCPCNIWSASTVPANIDSGDATPGEYGVRFQASGAGYIAGIRFYKSQANTGTHIGNLWSNTGTLLATVTFTNETATGWQQATFDSPVAVTAGTTYVASYYAPVGHYSFSPNFFSTDVTNAPLVALADGADGANGIYAYYGTTTFPTSTWDSNNYWVDVVYNQTDLPSIVAYTPASGATSVSISSSITATFGSKQQSNCGDCSLQRDEPHSYAAADGAVELRYKLFGNRARRNCGIFRYQPRWKCAASKRHVVLYHTVERLVIGVSMHNLAFDRCADGDR
jgi:hypothetical protein